MRRKIAALALAGGALAALAIPMSSNAQAALTGECDVWSDTNTFGAGNCNNPAGSQVMAIAKCKDGSTVSGATVPVSSMSYVHCAGKGGYEPGTGAYFVL
jgi:hypothetical protein